MTDSNRSRYTSKVKAVISDLAGTTVDFGSCAPAGTFAALFERHRIEVTSADARGPMGIHKKDHIQAILEMPHVGQQWSHIHGQPWTPNDLEMLYQEFIPMQLDALPKYGDVIPGVVETVSELRDRDIPVAVNTGYNREMLDVVLQKAREGGFVPEAALCASDVPKGRPAPWMIFRLMEKLDAYQTQTVVKIGDTIADIEAGLNAGVWTVGVTKTGNLVGLTENELKRLSPEESQEKVANAVQIFRDAKAHYVIDSFVSLPGVIADIESRLERAAGVPVA